MIPATPEPDASQAQIQRIVSSKALKGSELHRNLLTYLADKSLSGDAQQLKEYTVGLDVFGKPASYDPRQESVVRMHLGRLRQKLAEYYRTEGIDDPVIVDVPKGGFSVTFSPRPEAAPRRTFFPGILGAPSAFTLAAVLVILVAAVVSAGVVAMRVSRGKPGDVAKRRCAARNMDAGAPGVVDAVAVARPAPDGDVHRRQIGCSRREHGERRVSVGTISRSAQARCVSHQRG